MRRISFLSVLLIYIGQNMALKNTEGLFLTSKQVGLEVTSEKTKYKSDEALRV
jgi:hypothetical protein